MSRKAKRRNLSPRTARTFDDICALKQDNIDGPEGWALIDEGAGIILHQQKRGQESTASVVFSKRTFNRIVDWYNGARP